MRAVVLVLGARGGETVPVLGAGSACGIETAGAGAGGVSVLSLERSLSISAVGIYTLQVLLWPTAVSRAVLFARILFHV